MQINLVIEGGTELGRYVAEVIPSIGETIILDEVGEVYLVLYVKHILRERVIDDWFMLTGVTVIVREIENAKRQG